MDRKDKKDIFSIRHVAEATGVSPPTLRAWERRYGLIKPQRTPKGHRIYTEQDIFLVKNIVFILGQGIAISKAKDLINKEHIHLLEPDNYQSLRPRFEAIAEALGKFHHIRLETEMKALYTLYPPEQFADEILPRLLGYLEDNHFRYTDTAYAQKSFLLDLLQAKLYQYLYQNRHNNDKDAFLLVGYRTAMIQSRILHGLLLAHVIKAYAHKVDFISGLSSLEEIVELAKTFPRKKILVFTQKDRFHLNQLMAKFEKNGITHAMIHYPQSAKDSGVTVDGPYVLKSKFSNLYEALNLRRSDEV